MEIHDIFDDYTCKFYTLEEIKYHYGDIGNFIDYNALLLNIPQKWKDILMYKQNADTVIADVQDDSVIDIVERNAKISAKMYWFMIEISSDNYDHGRIAWQTELKTSYDEREWENIRLHGFRILTATKYQLFQFKLLSKKLTTNVIRHVWDTNISDKCTFCKNYKETTIHIFWECEKVSLFWKSIAKWLKHICNIQCDYNSENVIINVFDSKIVEIITLIAKQYIYACKCLQEDLRVTILASKINQMYNTEKAIAQQNVKTKNFRLRWDIYEKKVLLL